MNIVRLNYLKHKGIFSTYNTGLVAFFTIGLVLAIIIINVGFMVTDAQKKVVGEAMDDVDQYLNVVGLVSNFADGSSSKLIITAIPVKTASGGSVNVSNEVLNANFSLAKLENAIISHDDVYSGNLNDSNFNSLFDAIAAAKQKGLITANPYLEEQPSKTTFFLYWIINQNFDNKIDADELAVLTIVYAKEERPTSGEILHVQINNSENNILDFKREIPKISSSIVNFGGRLIVP